MVVYYTHWVPNHASSPEGGFLWDGAAPYSHSKVLLWQDPYPAEFQALGLKVTVQDDEEVIVEEL